MWTFAPAVVLPGQTIELPRPVTTLKVLDAWEAARFRVPGRPGEVARGSAPGGATLSVRGRVGTQDGTLAADEPAMLDALHRLRAALHALGPDETFGLAVYRDGSALRGFAGCTPLKVELDLSDPALFGYALTARAGEVALTDGPLA